MLPERRWGKPLGPPVGNEAVLLAACHPCTLSPAAAAPTIPPSRPAPVASRCRPALPERGPFSLALPGWERSLTHPGRALADAGGSSLIPSPCARGRR